jgi:hypothetical protein
VCNFQVVTLQRLCHRHSPTLCGPGRSGTRQPCMAFDLVDHACGTVTVSWTASLLPLFWTARTPSDHKCCEKKSELCC